MYRLITIIFVRWDNMQTSLLWLVDNRLRPITIPKVFYLSLIAWFCAIILKRNSVILWSLHDNNDICYSFIRFNLGSIKFALYGFFVKRILEFKNKMIVFEISVSKSTWFSHGNKSNVLQNCFISFFNS